MSGRFDTLRRELKASFLRAESFDARMCEIDAWAAYIAEVEEERDGLRLALDPDESPPRNMVGGEEE